MKTFVLVRHAKSSWKDSSLSDFDRPLNKRGMRDAPFMAQLIADKNIKPDLIYSSPAMRAFTTARHFAAAQGYPENKIDKQMLIYDYGPGSIIKLLNKAPNEYGTIFLFGHNPTITSLSNFLSGEDFINIPTCGVVCINFDFDDWNKLGEEKGALNFYEFPKMHKDEMEKL